MTFTPPLSFSLSLSSSVSLQLLSSPSSPFSTWFSTWYLVLTLILLLLILPVRSFSRDAALVFVEAELSLEVLLALDTNEVAGLSFQPSCMILFTLSVLVFVEAELSLEVLLALGFNKAVGLSFQLSCKMLFTFFRVDFARPFEVMLGILNCALSYFSTGFETRSDFLLDKLSVPSICGTTVCSSFSVIWRCIYFSGSGSGIAARTRS